MDFHSDDSVLGSKHDVFNKSTSHPNLDVARCQPDTLYCLTTYSGKVHHSTPTTAALKFYKVIVSMVQRLYI